MCVLGVGAGACFPSQMSLAMSGAAPEQAGLASGLANTTGQVGGALGLAVIASLASAKIAQMLKEGHSRLPALIGGDHVGFDIAAVAALCLALVAALALAPVTSPAPTPQVSGGTAEPRHAGTLATEAGVLFSISERSEPTSAVQGSPRPPHARH